MLEKSANRYAGKTVNLLSYVKARVSQYFLCHGKGLKTMQTRFLIPISIKFWTHALTDPSISLELICRDVKSINSKLPIIKNCKFNKCLVLSMCRKF